jgi:hypothetical protein
MIIQTSHLGCKIKCVPSSVPSIIPWSVTKSLKKLKLSRHRSLDGSHAYINRFSMLNELLRTPNAQQMAIGTKQ